MARSVRLYNKSPTPPTKVRREFINCTTASAHFATQIDFKLSWINFENCLPSPATPVQPICHAGWDSTHIIPSKAANESHAMRWHKTYFSFPVKWAICCRICGGMSWKCDRKSLLCGKSFHRSIVHDSNVRQTVSLWHNKWSKVSDSLAYLHAIVSWWCSLLVPKL